MKYKKVQEYVIHDDFFSKRPRAFNSALFVDPKGFHQKQQEFRKIE